MNSPTKGMGIFGGTFNPVHNGHIAVAESFLKSGLLTSLVVLVNPAPPHKKDESMAPYKARLKMVQAAFLGFENIEVSQLETHLPAPAYTVQTLAYLKQQTPDENLYLCIGSDSLQNFDSWYKWQKILDYSQLLVAERPDVKTNSVNSEILNKTTFVDHQPVDISSTTIRKKIAAGQPVSQYLPRPVEELIKQNDLYSSKK